MTKVFLAISPTSSRSDELIEELTQILQGSECEICLQPGDRGALATVPLVAECDIVLIVIDSAPFDPSLSEIVRLAKIGGKRVVVFRHPDEDSSALPLDVEKYGSSVVPWEPEAIRRAVCQGDDNWTLADGSERDTPSTPRHRCRPKKQAPPSNAAA